MGIAAGCSEAVETGNNVSYVLNIPGSARAGIKRLDRPEPEIAAYLVELL